jgi:hypothetical protein
MYFIGKSKSTTIVCEAYKVDNISVTCGGSPVRNVETLIKVDDNSEKSSSMVKVVEAKFTVTEEDVNNYGEGLYVCQCHGHYKVPGDGEDRTLSSTSGSVEVACKYILIFFFCVASFWSQYFVPLFIASCRNLGMTQPILADTCNQCPL